jgi:hypothetical protein
MLPDTRRQRGCLTDKESRETSMLARFFGDRLARDNNASATAMIAESRYGAKTAAAAAASERAHAFARWRRTRFVSHVDLTGAADDRATEASHNNTVATKCINKRRK